jgi:N-acylneuraminate cytidylyltransferase
MAPRVIAVVPARGGSVGIPLKNVKPLLGRPLIDWCVRAALDSGVFSEVYVSTDHDGIAEEALRSGAKVHRRAPETATSAASTESALVDFVQHHPDFDILCLIQATSPLVVPDDFVKALKELEDQHADSLVTVVRAHRFLWKKDATTGEAVPQNYDPLKRPRRQDWNGELIENGAFYYTRKPQWDKELCRLGGKMALFEMEEHTFAELDSEVDWEIVAGLCTKHGYFGVGASGRPT